MNRSIEERFWAKVAKGDACWLWTACVAAHGYGMFGVIRPRVVLAHRFSWELANGPIPAGEGYHGLCVCHHCDNPLCVRPDHLFLGTQADNVRDMVAKGRGARGANHPNAKLTHSLAARIRERVVAGESQSSVARWAGVSKATVCIVVNGKAWVPPADETLPSVVRGGSGKQPALPGVK